MLKPVASFAVGIAPFNADERERAARLGEIYTYLWRERSLPLGDWAPPSSLKGGVMHAALGSVYGTDAERARKMPRYKDRYLLYQEDFLSVIPRLTTPALQWASQTVDSEESTLMEFAETLEVPSVAEELAAAALRIRTTIGPVGTRDPSGLQDIAGERPTPNIDPNRWRAITIAVQEEDNQILNVLFLHPNSIRILKAYCESSTIGTRIARSYVADARAALREFLRSLSLPDSPLNVWRYPLLMFGAVTLLGAQNIPGFANFAASIGPAYSKNRNEVILSDARFIVLCLGLAFTATEMLAGVAVASAAEMLLALGQMGFAYLREREQDLAAKASALSGQRFAPAATYEDTIMYAVAALLAGIAMFQGTRQFLEASRLKRLIKLDELKPVASKTKLAKSGRGPADATARGIGDNDASVGRATGHGPGSRATSQEQASAKVKEQEVVPQIPQQPPPLDPARRRMEARTKNLMKAAKEPPREPFAPKSSDPPAKRQTNVETPTISNDDAAGSKVGTRGTQLKPQLPPYPEDPYQGAGFGGTARVREVGFGETDEALIAHEGRRRLMRAGKIDYNENIAVIKYRNPITNDLETAWAKSNGDQHAERILEAMLKDEFGPLYTAEMIEKLYTERIPCGKISHNCYGWIRSNLTNAMIEYSFFTRYTKYGTVRASDELMKFYLRSFDPLGNLISTNAP